MKFEELGLSENIKKGLKEYGYIDATPIQEEAIPHILEGRDLIGQSKTGTGKTASYSLPMIEKIDKNLKGIQAIVLCPTRELAVQISQEIRKFLKYQENIKIIPIYGGQSIERQIMGLKKGVQIVIGTPGRIMDHMRRKTIKLDNTSMVVLDEADEMLNMGFEEDIETILKDVPNERQTVLFSATMNKKIMQITEKYLINPKKVKIKYEDLTVENINQVAIEVKSKEKDDTVIKLIEKLEAKKTIIFCNTKKKVDELIEKIKELGYKAEALHGDIKQAQRDRIMKKIKSGEINVLIATDVAARGLDIKDLDLVINYDIPQEQEYYVHRIGRTGRNGENGTAYTLYTVKERAKLRDIERYAKTKITQGQAPSLQEVSKMKNEKKIKEIQDVINKGKFSNSQILEELIINNDIEKIAKALITMLTVTENVKPEPNKDLADENGNIRLFLNVGKKDKIMVKDIVGSITANCRIPGEEIGRINLLDKFSFVDVPKEYGEKVIKKMKGKLIHGKEVNVEIANS